MANTYI
jgi:hypothetical protein